MPCQPLAITLSDVDQQALEKLANRPSTPQQIAQSARIVLKGDGIQEQETAQLTLVDKMSALCVKIMPAESYAVLDAYFAAANLLKTFRQNNLHLISRVRRTTVAYAPFCPLAGRGRGRPRKWGTAVKLSDLFTQVLPATNSTLWTDRQGALLATAPALGLS